jgi:transposase
MVGRELQGGLLPVSFPKLKRKGRARDACRFTTGAIRVLPDRKHVQLPRVGILKTHESTLKLARRLEQGTARILAATVSRTADRWFVSFTVDVQRRLPVWNGRTTVVGVDVGIRHLAVLSTGVPPVASPRALERSQTTWNGSRLIVADRFYPSSKTCSACGWVKAKLTLAERTFQCDVCGLRIDRDLNAARNLAKLAQHIAQSGWEMPNARGVDVRPGLAGRTAMKREAGTGCPPEKAGTVGAQASAIRVLGDSREL